MSLWFENLAIVTTGVLVDTERNCRHFRDAFARYYKEDPRADRHGVYGKVDYERYLPDDDPEEEEEGDWWKDPAVEYADWGGEPEYWEGGDYEDEY